MNQKNRKVEVVPYTRDWVKQFEKESLRLKQVLSDLLVNIHHVGSTAIQGMWAKPTIDMMLEVKNIDQVDLHMDQMTSLGYESLGENGMKGRRYFNRLAEDGVTHLTHLHVFEHGSVSAIRHLAFRDFLRAHEELADFYGQLKTKLSTQFPYDIESYIEGKEVAIKKIEEQALIWWYEN
ncbi:GrpB family protein [Terrilactibacillus laevilacticus]|uniref:GrpB family protein n=1 Tax=Terrilactibacillus laevilacticus TaxID=1380157 RepID=A0ABW5PPI0_9BACI|nr:GrpB family protein [Terrilactibacillus laevilacticus]